MAPIEDVSLLFNIVKRLQQRVTALETLDLEHRISVIESRCADHEPIIDKIQEDTVRGDERRKTMKSLWSYLTGLGIGLGIIAALAANTAKICEFFMKLAQ